MSTPSKAAARSRWLRRSAWKNSTSPGQAERLRVELTARSGRDVEPGDARLAGRTDRVGEILERRHDILVGTRELVDLDPFRNERALVTRVAEEGDGGARPGDDQVRESAELLASLLRKVAHLLHPWPTRASAPARPRS